MRLYKNGLKNCTLRRVIKVAWGCDNFLHNFCVTNRVNSFSPSLYRVWIWPLNARVLLLLSAKRRPPFAWISSSHQPKSSAILEYWWIHIRILWQSKHQLSQINIFCFWQSKLKFYEPEEEVRKNCQGSNCAYVNSTAVIWTPAVFTQFFVGIIASRVTRLG